MIEKSSHDQNNEQERKGDPERTFDAESGDRACQDLEESTAVLARVNVSRAEAIARTATSEFPNLQRLTRTLPDKEESKKTIRKKKRQVDRGGTEKNKVECVCIAGNMVSSVSLAEKLE